MFCWHFWSVWSILKLVFNFYLQVQVTKISSKSWNNNKYSWLFSIQYICIFFVILCHSCTAFHVSIVFVWQRDVEPCVNYTVKLDSGDISLWHRNFRMIAQMYKVVFFICKLKLALIIYSRNLEKLGTFFCFGLNFVLLLTNLWQRPSAVSYFLT